MHRGLRGARRRPSGRHRKVGVHQTAREPEHSPNLDVISEDGALLHAHTAVDLQRGPFERGCVREVCEVHRAVDRDVLVHRQRSVDLGLLHPLQGVQAHQLCPVERPYLQGLKPLLRHQDLPLLVLLAREGHGLLGLDPLAPRVQRNVAPVHLPNGEGLEVVLRQLQRGVPIRVVKNNGTSDPGAAINIQLLHGGHVGEDRANSGDPGVEHEELPECRPVLLFRYRLQPHMVLGETNLRARRQNQEGKARREPRGRAPPRFASSFSSHPLASVVFGRLVGGLFDLTRLRPQDLHDEVNLGRAPELEQQQHSFVARPSGPGPP